MGISLERNSELGQVWTPDEVASRMSELALSFCDNQPKLVIDPACGPATFLRALCPLLRSDTKYLSYDVDRRWATYTKKYLEALNLHSEVFIKDYLRDWKKKPAADVLIMNPPYIRQEKIPEADKSFYLEKIRKELGIQLDRRSNLFVYFFVKALRDVKAGGIICAIVYDALDNTKYGVKAMSLIRQYCEILHQEKAKAPFENVLIDATILVLKVRRQPLSVIPETVSPPTEGFVRLGDLVDVRRGLGLSYRSAFEANINDSCYQYAKVFVSKQRKIDGLVFKGRDVQERAYLFEDEAEIPRKLQKELLCRLEKLGAKEIRFTHKPAVSPIIFNYYIRNNPRHLLNVNQVPASDNFYLITPKALSNKATWLLLNSTYYLDCLLSSARSQGNGLKKLQLYEYKETIVPDWRLLSSREIVRLNKKADDLCKVTPGASISIQKIANKLLEGFDLWEAISAKVAA